MIIEVTTTEPPAQGRKLASVLTRDGAKFKFDPDRLRLHDGQRYEIEAEENEFKGRVWHKIVKATPIPGEAIDKRARSNGASRSASEAEREFVRSLLVAAVGVGAVAFGANELRGATSMLKALWRDSLS